MNTHKVRDVVPFRVSVKKKDGIEGPGSWIRSVSGAGSWVGYTAVFDSGEHSLKPEELVECSAAMQEATASVPSTT